MTLRRKTLLIVGLTLLSLSLVMYVTAELILMADYHRLEEQDVHRNVQRIANAISDELDRINAAILDWAHWDDAYQYMLTRDPEFVTDNIYYTSFETLEVNMMLFVSPERDIVTAAAYDFVNDQDQTVPAGMIAHLAADSPFLQHIDQAGKLVVEGHHGILLIDGTPTLTASAPILTTQRTGPPSGTLVWGRYLDATLVADISTSLELNISLVPLADHPAPDKFTRTLPSHHGTIQATMIYRDDQTLDAYLMHSDEYGNPAFTLRVVLPRTITQQGRSTLTYFALLLALFSAIFVSAVMVVLEREVLRRLTGIVSSVRLIAEHRNASTRLPTSGNDELALLTTSINEMLRSLDESKREVAEREAHHRALVEAIPDVMLRFDRHDVLMDVRPGSGSPPLEIKGMSLLQIMGMYHLLLPDDFLPNVVEGLRLARDSAGAQIYEFTAKADNELQRGKVIHFEARLVAVRDGSGEVLVLVRDITERKQAEQSSRSLLMLKEIHHRIKNNLQVISSMLSLQAKRVADPHIVELFDNSRSRVRSMALIHEKLYKTEGVRLIDFADYVRDLAGQLLASHNAAARGVRAKVTAEGQFLLTMDAAVPCGLIVNELILNALKHAFPDNREEKGGEIAIRLCQDGQDNYRMVISDTGRGFPESINFRKTESLGLQLVNSLTKQLHGSLTLESGPGTTFTVEFSNPNHSTNGQ